MSNNLFSYYINKTHINGEFNIKIPKQKEDTPDWCYLMYSPTSNLFKIGITGNLKQRQKHLISQSGTHISLLFSIQLEPEYDESAKFIEQTLHCFYKDRRCLGEWFKLNRRDCIEIYDTFIHIGGDDMFDNFRYEFKNLPKTSLTL
jgi:hypothetical protein